MNWLNVSWVTGTTVAGCILERLAGREDRGRARGVDAADLDQAELAVGEDPARECRHRLQRPRSLPSTLVNTSYFANTA